VNSGVVAESVLSRKVSDESNPILELSVAEATLLMVGLPSTTNSRAEDKIKSMAQTEFQEQAMGKQN
jgi:hypothetical protein